MDNGDKRNIYFDNYFKRKYRDHTVYPDPYLWNNIESKLKRLNKINKIKNLKEKKRRYEYLKIAMISTFMIIISLFIYYDNSKQLLLPGTKNKSTGKMIYKGDSLIHVKNEKENENEKNLVNDTASYSSKIEMGFKSDNRQLINNRLPGSKFIKVIKIEDLTSNRENSPVKVNLSGINNVIIKEINTYPIAISDYTYSKVLRSSLNFLHKRIKSNPASSKKNNIFIEFIYLPQISYRTLSLNHGVYNSEYNKGYFNSRDKITFSYSTGILAGYHISNKFSILIGLVNSQYALHFNTMTKNILYDTVYNHYIYTSSGRADISILTLDSGSVNDLLKSSIQLNYLELPILSDLKISSRYSLQFGFDVSYLYNQSLNWEAKNYNGNSEQGQNKINGLHAFKIETHLGINYDQPLFKGLHLIFSPTLKFDLMALSKTAPVKAFPYALGMTGGLRYYF